MKGKCTYPKQYTIDGQKQKSGYLQTKLYIPPPRPDLVPRPHLIERLSAGLHCKLTLISAPTGLGKTTLLSQRECVEHLVTRPSKRLPT